MSIDQLIAALVPVIVVFFGWFLRRMDRRNTSQHADAVAQRTAQADYVNKTLERIEDKVEANGTLLNDHIMWHAHNKNQEVLVK